MFFNKKYFNFFFLGREDYYHKIQYSKVSKHDIAAAILGVVIGSFVVYLSLNTLGSGSPDLTDLALMVWYLYLFFKIGVYYLTEKFSGNSFFPVFLSFLFFFIL